MHLDISYYRNDEDISFAKGVFELAYRNENMEQWEMVFLRRKQLTPSAE
jgi:hypothetical protein